MIKWLQNISDDISHEVSILIPTYNNVQFLEECIHSIVSSSNKCCKYEILIGIDNCYKTLQLVDSNTLFKNKNIKIYYFPKNVGPYIIRNSIANKAKYDNLLFFDSDDIMMANTIQTLMENFEGKELLKFKFYNFENENGYKTQDKLSLSKIYAHASFLIKKNKFYEMNGFFGWKCGADAEFTERYEGQGNNIQHMDVPLFYRRYHNNNITRLPETGLNSKLRSRYGKIIIENRINQKWKNPNKPEVFVSNLIVV